MDCKCGSPKRDGEVECDDCALQTWRDKFAAGWKAQDQYCHASAARKAEKLRTMQTSAVDAMRENLAQAMKGR